MEYGPLPDCRLICGDALEALMELKSGTVDCVVTSPPYWGLRDYGTVGQLGLEASPGEYVSKLVGVFGEVWRVLRDDGTLWLNLGDSYAGGGGRKGCRDENAPPRRGRNGRKAAARGQREGSAIDPKRANAYAAQGLSRQPSRLAVPGLKPKDLVGIPWRVAFALQDAGWTLRSDIIWHKPNCMPSSVKDRPTVAHEYVFLLSKSRRYYYDADAIHEPVKAESILRAGRGRRVNADRAMSLKRPQSQDRGEGEIQFPAVGDGDVGRNRRTVWEIGVSNYRGAHFAVMPEKLVEPCVLAGSRRGGWVLDPFMGTGTVGLVAVRHGRGFVGIDISSDTVELARERLAGVQVEF